MPRSRPQQSLATRRMASIQRNDNSQMAGDIHLRQSDRVFSQRQPNRPAALSLSFEIDRQLAPCGSIVTVLEPTSRNTDTQGHTSSIASKTLGKRAAATHNLTGKTRGFRHTNRTLRCVLPSIGNIKDHPQTEQLSRPEPGMRAGRYVHIGRHRPAIQNTSPDSRGNQQWSPRSSRAQALRSPLVRAVTHHKQQNAPCCRREHPNLLVAILDDANHRAGGSSRRCLTPSDMFRPGSATDARRVASSASIAALFLQRAGSVSRTASRCESSKDASEGTCQIFGVIQRCVHVGTHRCGFCPSRSPFSCLASAAAVASSLIRR